eukprot:jgi/Tetstr1/426137/TSEL_016465.t1
MPLGSRKLRGRQRDRLGAALFLVALQATTAGAVIAPADVGRASGVAEPCRLQEARNSSVKAGSNSMGGGVRSGVEGAEAAGLRATAVRRFCEFNNGRYMNDHCSDLPPLEPSPGCAVNQSQLSARHWYDGGGVNGAREILFVGDSVVQQMYRGTVCELAHLVPFDKLPQASARIEPPTSATGEGGVAKSRRRLTAVRCSKKCKRFGDLKVCYMRVEQDPVNAQVSACLREAQSTDVVALNVGLWHNSGRSMSSAMSGFNKFMAQSGQDTNMSLPHLLRLETPPQHFNTRGGNFGRGVLRGRQAKGKQCMSPDDAVEANMEQFDFRNRAAYSALGNLGIPVFRSWDMLRHSPQLHVQLSKKPGSPGPMNVDCTHWCEGPVRTSPIAALSQILLSDVLRHFWSNGSMLAPMQARQPQVPQPHAAQVRAPQGNTGGGAKQKAETASKGQARKRAVTAVAAANTEKRKNASGQRAPVLLAPPSKMSSRAAQKAENASRRQARKRAVAAVAKATQLRNPIDRPLPR